MKANDKTQKAAETAAVPDEPISEVKPVTENDSKAASVSAFANRPKTYAGDAGGQKISNDAVYASDSPRGGSPIDSISTDVGRSAGSGNYVGGGNDPVDKINRIEADAYDNTSAPTTVVQVVGADEDPKALVSTNFKTNVMRGMKMVNTGSAPVFAQPYRRVDTEMSTEKIAFVVGQMDAASPSLGYPTQTLSMEGLPVILDGDTTGTELQDADGRGRGIYETTDASGNTVYKGPRLHQSNYLIHGMKFTLDAQGRTLADVTFDVEEIPIESDAYTLDVATDHGKLRDNIAQQKVTEWAKMINEKGTDFFSPIASGIQQPSRHARQVNDIKAVDGAIVYAAVKSMLESYAYGLNMRKIMGGSTGSLRLGAYMTRHSVIHEGLNEGIVEASSLPTWPHAGEMYTPANAALPNDVGIAGFMGLFQSQRAWNGYYGNLIQQPVFQQVFKNAIKYIDELNWKIDKDTLAMFNKLYGWFEDSEEHKRIGVSRFGIVSPYNPNEYFKFVRSTDDETALEGTCHIQNSTTVSDGAISMIGSDLFAGLVKYFKEKFLPKVQRNSNGTALQNGVVYLNFDFPTDRFTFAQFFIADAMASIAALDGEKYINGAYRQFKETYGVDPYDDDVTTSFGLNDMLTTASFRGLGTDPVYQEAHDALKLIISDPEFIMPFVSGDTAGVGSTNGAAGLLAHPMIGHFDASDYDERFVVYKPIIQDMDLTSRGLKRIMSYDTLTLLCTRDYPVKMYDLYDSTSPNATPVTMTELDGQAEIARMSTMNVPGVFSVGAGVYVDFEGEGDLYLFVKDVVGARRLNGRIAPAPAGCIDPVMRMIAANPGAVDGVTGAIDYNYSGTKGSLLTKELLHAQVDETTLGGTISLAAAPLESYRTAYLFDNDSVNRYGNLNYHNLLSIDTMCMSETVVPYLATHYGIWLDMPGEVDATAIAEPFIDNGFFEVPLNFMVPLLVNRAATQYPFYFSPLCGMNGQSVNMTGTSQTLADDLADIIMMSAFGLKYFAKEYWNRYATSIIDQLNAASNMVLDNNVERANNILL